MDYIIADPVFTVFTKKDCVGLTGAGFNRRRDAENF